MNIVSNNTGGSLSRYNHSSKLESGYYYLIRVLLFVMVIGVLVFFSSLSATEMNNLHRQHHSHYGNVESSDIGKSNIYEED